MISILHDRNKRQWNYNNIIISCLVSRVDMSRMLYWEHRPSPFWRVYWRIYGEGCGNPFGRKILQKKVIFGIFLGCSPFPEQMVDKRSHDVQNDNFDIRVQISICPPLSTVRTYKVYWLIYLAKIDPDLWPCDLKWISPSLWTLK